MHSHTSPAASSNPGDRSIRSHVIHGILACSGLLLLAAVGCAVPSNSLRKTVGNDTSEVDQITHQVDNPSPPVYTDVRPADKPVTIRTVSIDEISHTDWALDQIVQYGLENSTVLRDIGGTILRSPANVTTTLSTQLQETDPRYGMEAALSAFDAQLAASATFDKNDRLYNNAFFAGGTNAFQQDFNDYSIELSKRSATGSRIALRSLTNYDSNNAPANLFTSSWDSWFEGEIRQPLLQGGGLEFNRIAGPGATPGIYNGVLIAKVNSDINQADFTIAMRDYVSNVENAYWDLYLAYRELDARKKAMERSLVLWNEVQELAKAGGANAGQQEALARNQYFQMKAEVDEALSGKVIAGTQVRNGATGGTLQPGNGVLAAERRLRLLIGMPASDGTLVRPSDEPTLADIRFDWDSGMEEALTQRPEMQRQNVAVKKRELELLAARNFLNPSLDAVGRYRFRGFGHRFADTGNQKGIQPASALGNLATGDYQEWTLGVELTVPIGYRKGHAAVQHAELSLARERAIQREMQREIISNLNGAFADVDRAYQSVQNTLNQYLAAKDYVRSLEADQDLSGRIVDRAAQLDALQRMVQAEIKFFRARAEYGIALKNVHYERGSLLDYKRLLVAGENLAPDGSSALPHLESSPMSPESTPVPDAPVDAEAANEFLPPVVTSASMPDVVVTGGRREDVAGSVSLASDEESSTAQSAADSSETAGRAAFNVGAFSPLPGDSGTGFPAEEETPESEVHFFEGAASPIPN